MELKIGNYAKIRITEIRDSDGNIITNLATADSVLYMIKNNSTDLDAAALVSKSSLVAGQMALNTPDVGDVEVTILSTDTATLSVGEKYHALKIKRATAQDVEINFLENSIITNKIQLVENVVKG